MKDIFPFQMKTVQLALATLFCAASSVGFSQISWDDGAGDGLWSSPNNWSGNVVPGNDDDVEIIGDYVVTINANDSCKSLVLQSQNGNNRDVQLIVDGARLGVRENLTMDDRNSSGNTCNLHIQNGGFMVVGESLYMTKDNSAANNNDMTVTLEDDNSKLLVDANIVVVGNGNANSDIGFQLVDDSRIECTNLTANFTNDRQANYEFFQINKTGSNGDKAVVDISGDVTITSGTGNQEFNIAINYSGELNIGGDFSFTSTSGEDFEIFLNRNATLDVTGDFTVVKAGDEHFHLYLNQTNDGNGTDAQFNVGGNMSITQSDGDQCYIYLNEDADISIGGNLTIIRTGIDDDGDHLHIELLEDSKMDIGSNFIVTLNSGKEYDFLVDLLDNSELEVGANWTITQTDADRIIYTVEDNATLDIDGSWTMSNDADGERFWFDFDNTSTITVAGNLTVTQNSGANILFDIDRDANMNVSGNGVLTQNNDGDVRIYLNQNNDGGSADAQLTFGGQLSIDQNGSDQVHFYLKDNADLTIGNGLNIDIFDTDDNADFLRFDIIEQSGISVSGDVTILLDQSPTGNDPEFDFYLEDDASFSCTRGFTLTHEGGEADLNIIENTTLSIGGAFAVNMNEGLAFDMIIEDAADVDVGGDFTFQQTTAGDLFDIDMDNTATFDIAGNVDWNDTGNGRIYLELDRDAAMTVSGNFDISKTDANNGDHLRIHLNVSSDGSTNDAQLNIGGDMNVAFTGGNDLDIQLNRHSDLIVGGSMDIQFLTHDNPADDELNIVLDQDSRISVTGSASIQNAYAAGTKNPEITLNDNSEFSVGNPVGPYNKQMVIDMESSNGADFDITVNDDALFNVYGELLIDKDAGTDMNIELNTNAIMNVYNDLDLDNDQGSGLILVQLNNNSNLEVKGDLDMSSASNSNQIRIEQNDNTKFFLGGSTVQTSGRGTWDCQATTTVEFNGTDIQTINGEAGNGSDYFNFQNLIINNSRSGDTAVVFNGLITVEEGITFTDGVLVTTATNLLEIADGASTSGASDASYVKGYVRKVGNTPSGEFVGNGYAFPVGDAGNYRPIYIEAPVSNTASFDARYNYTNAHDAGYDSSALSGSIAHISKVEFWDLEQSAGSSTVYVTLSFDDVSGGVDSLAGLRVAHWNSGTSTWEDLGNGGTTGSTASGTVRTLAQVSSFSPFTNASSNSANNPLPIELIYFDAQANSITEEIDLFWSTASEINNDYFEIERSIDGTFWELVTRVDGAGNSSRQIDYQVHDFNPFVGTSYYRLKQVDVDGSRSYSTVVAVIMVYGEDANVEVFPNPTKGLVHLRGDLEVLNNFRVYSMSGNDHSNQVEVIQNSSSLIILDLSKLPVGMYTIKGEEYSQKLIKN